MPLSLRVALTATSSLGIVALSSYGAAAAAPTQVRTEEVIVTAQRRSERSQRVPVAVTAIGAAQLAKAQITTENDLRSAAPGLTVRSSRSSNELNFALRGQTVDALSDARPGVLPYFNNVQVSGGGISSAFYDLQSIQVLKGPQGTLFGRGATGGAVLYTTEAPTKRLSGYISVAGGSFNTGKVEGAISFPVIKDVLLVRLSGFFKNTDGFQYNLYDHANVGGYHRYGLRGSITYQPTADLKNDLVIDYAHLNGESTQAVLYNFGHPYNPSNPGNSITTAPLPVALFYGPRGNPLLGQGVGLLPGQTDIVTQLEQQKARGPYVLNYEGPNYYRTNTLIITDTATYNLNPDTQIKSIFGYASVRPSLAVDDDGTNLTLVNNPEDIPSHELSEELQVLGKALSGKLSYVVGGFFSKEQNSEFSKSDVIPTLGVGVQNNFYRQKNTTFAPYAQATYDLASLTGIHGLGFTLGARFTDEKATNDVLPGDVSYTAANLANPLVKFGQSVTSRNFGWTIGMQDQATSNLLLYVVSRRAFKDAGFNGTNAPFVGLGSVNGGNRYGSETLTDVEIGAKMRTEIFAMPARFNIAAYYDWIKDAQHVDYAIGAGGAPSSITVNVPFAVTRGFELDGQINPTPWLELGGSAAYVDANFTSNLVRGVPFGPYPDTPKWVLGGFANVTFPISNNLDFSIRGDVYTQSGSWFTSTGNVNDGAFLPGYTLANFRVGLDNDAAGWSITANVKNAFNRTYYVGGIAVAQLFQFNSAVPGEPRSFVIEARQKF